MSEPPGDSDQVNVKAKTNALVTAIQNTDAASEWEELFRLLWPQLFRMARAMCASAEDAEDAVMEAWARAIEALSNPNSYRHEGEFKAWILQVLRHLIFDRTKRASKRPTTAYDDDDALEDPTAKHPAQDLELAPVEEIRRALELLDTHWTVYLLLHDLDGYSYEEIGQILCEPATTVKGRCRWARIHLGNVLKRLRKLETVPWASQVRALLDSTFSQHDITDAWALASNLKTPPKPVFAYLRERLTQLTRDILDAWDDSKRKPRLQEDLARALLNAVNAIREGEPVEDAMRSMGVPDRADSCRPTIVTQDPADLPHRNRVWLEDAYPDVLRRSCCHDGTCVEAWRLFFVERLSVQEVMLRMHRSRDAIVATLREAFEKLRPLSE